MPVNERLVSLNYLLHPKTAQGAQVLLVTSPRLPSLPYLDTETSLGKRTTQLHLSSTSSTDVEKMNELVRGADVFLQAYRPEGLKGRGFGVDDVLKLKAGHEEGGVVCASLRAWGWDGPWAHRRGVSACAIGSPSEVVKLAISSIR